MLLSYISFEGKLRKYDISMKRKHTKTNENMIFSALFFFSSSAIYIQSCTKFKQMHTIKLKQFSLIFVLSYINNPFDHTNIVYITLLVYKILEE